MPPTAAMTGSPPRRRECSAPPGAVASMISFIASPKKKAMATSLTAKWSGWVKRPYPSGLILAQKSAVTAPATIRSEFARVKCHTRANAVALSATGFRVCEDTAAVTVLVRRRVGVSHTLKD